MNFVNKNLPIYIFFIFCLFYNLSFFDINLKNILRITAFLIIFIYYFLCIIIEKNIYKRSYSEYILVVIGLLFIIILQFVYGKVTSTSISKYIDIYALFFIVIIISDYMSKKISLYKLLEIIKVSCCIPIITSFIVKPNNLEYSRDLFGEVRIRYKGLFAHPNHLGAMCLVTLIICVILIVKYKKKNNYLMIILIILPMYLSQSRTSIIIFCIFYILVFGYTLFYRINSKQNKVRIIMLLCFLVISICYILFMNNNIIDLDYINKLTSGRVISIIMLMKSNISPFIGQGPISNNIIIFIFGKAIDSSLAIVYYQLGIFGLILFYGNLLRVGVISSHNTTNKILIKSLIIIFIAYSSLENIMTNLVSIFGIYILIIIYCLYLDKIEKENYI